MEVWADVANEEAMCAVYDRLVKNYAIIRKTKGDNNLIEEFRGKSGKIAPDAMSEVVGDKIEEEAVFGDEDGGEIDLDEAVGDENYKIGVA